jgi:hypothetical protein
MTDGSLVVEPTPSTATGRFGRVIKPELHPCSLCGEARKEDEHLRTHRFRVSESDTTQVGYPLCKYCLGRVRSTCEFLGFLRIIKDGHWRADDEDAEKAAWEESGRLREQMFWSRIRGGVVPTGHARRPSSSSAAPSLRGEKSPRPSHESVRRPAEPAKQFLELPKTPEKERAEVVLEVGDQPASVVEGVEEVPAEKVVVGEETSAPAVDGVVEAPTEKAVVEEQTSVVAVDSVDEVPAEKAVAEEQTSAADNTAEQQPDVKPVSEAGVDEAPTEQVVAKEQAPEPAVDSPAEQQLVAKPASEATEQKQVPLTAPISITF